jgi:hypothetical protein
MLNNQHGLGLRTREGNKNQRIVLSYKASCVRETITGGTVTVEIERSQVQSGEVERIVGRCGSGKRKFYRPELHYMRGPGPKWLERHGRSVT